MSIDGVERVPFVAIELETSGATETIVVRGGPPVAVSIMMLGG